MARFLITMLPANDLGLPTRMVPIARALADRGHEVAVFNPAPAPSRLIAEAGLINLPMPARPMPAPAVDLTMVAEGWDVEHFFAGFYTSEEYVRDATAVYVDLVRDYAPDMVVDSFEPIACLAARIAKVPLATVLQGNIHPASRGFTWWEDERPAGLPSAAAHFSAVAQEYGLAPVKRIVDLMAGDLALIVGTPETDPVAADAEVTYIGPMVFQRSDAALPTWVEELRGQNGHWPRAAAHLGVLGESALLYRGRTVRFDRGDSRGHCGAGGRARGRCADHGLSGTARRISNSAAELSPCGVCSGAAHGGAVRPDRVSRRPQLGDDDLKGRNAGGDHSHDYRAGEQCATARIAGRGRSGDAGKRRRWREAGGCGRVQHESEARAERALLP